MPSIRIYILSLLFIVSIVFLVRAYEGGRSESGKAVILSQFRPKVLPAHRLQPSSLELSPSKQPREEPLGTVGIPNTIVSSLSIKSSTARSSVLSPLKPVSISPPSGHVEASQAHGLTLPNGSDPLSVPVGAGGAVTPQKQNRLEKREMGIVLSVAPGDKHVTLLWDAAYGGSGFSVYYGTSPSVSSEDGIKKFCPTTPCTISGLANDIPYYFAIAQNDVLGQDPVTTISSTPTDYAHNRVKPHAEADKILDCGTTCFELSVLRQEATSSRTDTDCTVSKKCVPFVPASMEVSVTLDAVSRLPSVAPNSLAVTPLPNEEVPIEAKAFRNRPVEVPAIMSETVPRLSYGAVSNSVPAPPRGLVEIKRSRPMRKTAASPFGDAIAVWQQGNGKVQAIWASQFVVGQGWKRGMPISTGTEGEGNGNAFFPQVAVGSSGDAMAVWYQSDGAQYNIWANRFVPKSGWGRATRIETENEGDAVFPQVAMDSSGNALAIWYQSDGTRYNIWANRFVPESGWGKAVRIETENAGSAFSPSVAIDPAGNAVVAWYQSDGQHYNIWANRFTSLGWKTAVQIAAGDKTLSAAPQVIVDPLGNAVVAWHRMENGTPQTWVNGFMTGLGWGTAHSLATNVNMFASP